MNMKMNVTGKVHVDQRLLQEIKTEVKETIAVGVELQPKEAKRIFCAAELWNIHRQRKQFLQRRTL